MPIGLEAPFIGFLLVRLKGLEPPLCHQKRILNPPRLPFRHSRNAQQDTRS